MIATLARALAAAAIALAAAPIPVAADSAPLADRHRAFLAEVEVLLSPAERAAFAALARDWQRDDFIRRFWQVRDPFPQTAANEFADRFRERLALARDRYADLSDDRARVLLLLGEARSAERSLCGELLRPLELWRYDNLSFVAGFSLVFLPDRGVGRDARHRLWSPREGLMPLAATIAFGAVAATDVLQRLAEDCPRGEALASALAGAVDFDEVRGRIPGARAPSEEWVATFAARSTELPAGAERLPARLELSFVGRNQSRTVVRGALAVSRTALASSAAPQASFLIDGEILAGDELFERFRYRFDLDPAATPGEEIPLLFERALRPGRYRLSVRLQLLPEARFFRDERELEVPVFQPAAGALAGAPPHADPVPLAAESLPSEPAASLQLLAPGGDLLTGRARIEARTTGEAIAKVTFALNGKPVLTKGRPPWSVELDFGKVPKTHQVQASAFDAGGHLLASDEIAVNGGPHRFRVRLLEPIAGTRVGGSLRAVAEVDVPDGEELDRVEFYLNDQRLATLFQPPFSQPLALTDSTALAWVRAVAVLGNGLVDEALAVVNPPPGFEQLAVNVVELFTSALDGRGRPVTDLSANDFVVREDGKTQRLSRFEPVEQVPIHAALLIDTSSSMLEELHQAEAAAFGFLTGVLEPRDRAAIVAFNEKPRLAVRFTGSLEVLAGGLAGLVADGDTALYDSIVYALHYMSGVRGRRAAIVLTDGVDSRSRYPFADLLEFARRAGVPIYVIALDLPANHPEVRLRLDQLTRETGGALFQASGASQLAGIYRRIEEELRAQYLLVYQSSASDNSDRYRSVEVEVKRRGVAAKTVRGYYP